MQIRNTEKQDELQDGKAKRSACFVELDEMVRSGAKPRRKKALTLDELRRAVRLHGGNPQSKRHAENWDSIRCRAFLLQKRKVAELRDMMPESLKSKKAKLTKDQLVTLLSHDRTCY